MAKRSREPDEALQQTEKRPRLQGRKTQWNPEPSKNRRKGNEEKPGRPVPSSHAASQAQLPQPPPIQLSSQQPQLDPEWSDSETSTCYSRDAAAYDVRRDEEIDVIPHAKDIEYWRSEKAAKFIGSRSGLDGNWVGVRPLGEGGNGIAGLWELRDDDGQTVKQMAVKEESYSEREWLEHKDIRDVPDEIKVMSKLNKAKCHAITRLFNYKRYPHVYKHRMYMEFCPHNDLDRLIKRYSRFRQFIPEAFLWDTFYHLVEAAVAMRSGTGDWEFEIVHRDLKPANVFLGAENPKKGFPFYPVAKVGDFGYSVMTNHEDPANPSRLRGAGTEGYMAPEQQESGDKPEKPEEPQHRHRLSAYTNVWAIGAIMLELLTLYQHAGYMNSPGYHLDNGQIEDIETVRKPEYDKDLRDLIRRCVEPNPLKRIKLQKLRSLIKSSRDGSREYYTLSSKDKRKRIHAKHRLYYVGNEINNMPPGNWQPPEGAQSQSSQSEGVDPKFPVVYPSFPDGPETQPDNGPTLPSKDQKGKGHRFSKPILIPDGNDSADEIWKRKQGPPRPVRQDESSSDGRRPLDRNLDVARGIGGVRDDDDNYDDDGGSEDGDTAMDLQVSEPPSPSPPKLGESDMDSKPPSPDDLVRYKAFTSAPTTGAELRLVAQVALQVPAPIAPMAHVLAQAQAPPQVHAQLPASAPPALPPAPAPAPQQTALQAVAHAALLQVQAPAPPQPLQPVPQVQVKAPRRRRRTPPPPPPPPALSPKRLRNGKVRGELKLRKSK